jgi:hypothetical protein
VVNTLSGAKLGGPRTETIAVSLVRPFAEAVIVAVPAVVAVSAVLAEPPAAVTGEAGLKVPDTPLKVNVTALCAVGTFKPLASWMYAVSG